MKAYQIMPNRRNNWEWNALLSKPENIAKSVIKNIENDISLQEERSIKMILHNLQPDKSLRKEVPFTSDIIRWGEDLLLDAYRPSGKSFAIISSKIKTILEQFSIAPHQFIPLELVVAEQTETKALNYFLFRFIGSMFDDIDFQKSEYTFFDNNSQKVVRTEIGSFSSYDAFTEAQNKIHQESNHTVQISKRVLTKTYDIPYGLSSIIINEKVKDAILLKEPNGILIKPFNKFEIINSANQL